MDERVKRLLDRAIFLDEKDAHEAANLIGRTRRRNGDLYTDVSTALINNRHEVAYGAPEAIERLIGRVTSAMGSLRRRW